MGTTYLVVTVLFAALVAFSGFAKISRDPRLVKLIHPVAGISLKYIPLLAVCEFAGALGLVGGIWWPTFGVAAGIGLLLYFAGAMISHILVGNSKATAPAVFMWAFAAAALALRLLTTHA